MKSYYECVEELDVVAGEIHQLHGEPDHAIQVGGLNLDYGMTAGRLLYRPDSEPRTEIQSGLELTLSNASRSFHRYSLSRENLLVIVQFAGTPLRKNELRKPKEDDSVLESRELGRVAQLGPYMILTVTGLRRLTSDMAEFKEKAFLAK